MPVLARSRPVTGESRNRRASVPVSPATASAVGDGRRRSGGIEDGLEHGAALPVVEGQPRAVDDDGRRRSAARAGWRPHAPPLAPSAVVAGRPRRQRQLLEQRARPVWLSLSRSISPTISRSGGDSTAATSTAPTGATPDPTPAPTDTPRPARTAPASTARRGRRVGRRRLVGRADVGARREGRPRVVDGQGRERPGLVLVDEARRPRVRVAVGVVAGLVAERGGLRSGRHRRRPARRPAPRATSWSGVGSRTVPSSRPWPATGRRRRRARRRRRRCRRPGRRRRRPRVRKRWSGPSTSRAATAVRSFSSDAGTSGGLGVDGDDAPTAARHRQARRARLPRQHGVERAGEAPVGHRRGEQRRARGGPTAPG